MDPIVDGGRRPRLAVLSGALHRCGWRVEALPGDDVRFERGDGEEQVRPFIAVMGLFEGTLTRDTWVNMWTAAGIADLDLVVAAAT